MTDPIPGEHLVRSFIAEVWNRGDFAAGAPLFADGFTHHDLVTGRETDLRGYFDSIRILRTVFPDVRLEVRDLVAGVDRVATWWTASGTQQAEFAGIAARGRSIEVHGMSIDRCSADRISENWTVWDRHGLLVQLRGDG